MKKTLLISLLLSFVFQLNVFSQNDTKYEVIILRVNHYLKTDGLTSRLSIETYKNENSSFNLRFENKDKGVINYKNDDGTIMVFNEEVDIVNFIENNGFIIQSVYTEVIGGRCFVNYVFQKEYDK